MSFKRGYSLVEAVVTLALLAVLAAVLIPQVLGSNKGAADTAARQSLGAVVEDQSSIFSSDGALSDSPERLSVIDNERTFLSSAEDSTSSDVVSVGVRSNTMGIAAAGENGTCWYLQHTFEGPTGPGQIWAFKDGSATCRAETALSLTLGSGPNDGSSASRPLNLNN